VTFGAAEADRDRVRAAFKASDPGNARFGDLVAESGPRYDC
jgi:hypothetical protein